MQINIELTEADVRQLILDHIQSKLGDIKLDKNRVRILVKSAQNYKSEWEDARFRATYSTES